MTPPLPGKYNAFKKLTASEQVKFAGEYPMAVCELIWYLEGQILSLNKAVFE